MLHSLRTAATAVARRQVQVQGRRVVLGRTTTRGGAQQQRRTMGSDMPVPQSQNAPLWHGHTVAKEGWEESLYFYYAVGIFLQIAIITLAPETSIESWARPEAQARLLLKEQGKELEFGKHYATEVFQTEQLAIWDKFTDQAMNPGEDDDDDDDDDDDEDDEDEEEDDDDDDE